jgi:PilZ domain-containing protein
MDRRREPRIRAYETVSLTVLGDAGYTTSANAIQLSSHGLRLVLDRPIPVNAAIKVVCDDWLGLGEVCYCNEERGHYVVGLQLDQALVGLEDLAERNRDRSTDERLPAADEVEQLLS